jgi:signal transduction histidine kinase
MLMGGNNGVFLWEEGKGLIQQWHRRDGLVSEDVWALHADDEGGAWVGTFKGLHRLGPGGKLLPGPKALEKVNVQCIVRHDDRLWVGSDKGLAELDPKGRVLALHDPAGTAGGYSSVHCILPRQDDLLIGSSFGLLSFRNGAFTRAFPGNPMDNMQILSLHLDKSQRLWVGTAQGLQVREPSDGSWVPTHLEAGGQPLYGITWIRELSSGIMAAGHLKGVTLMDSQGRSFPLTRRMGLISDETNQASALQDQRGRLWVGMVGGVCILDRVESLPTVAPPAPVVLDVTWERGAFWLPRDVTLPRGFTNLAVHVDAGSPNTPFPVRIESRLDEGADPWHPLDPGQSGIYFGGLSYGTHQLHFRASLDGSTWRESEPVILRIQPPWYLTLWAKGGLVLLLLIAGVALVRHRFRQLEKSNRDLEDRVQTRTRELEVKSQELVLRNQSMEWIHRELRSTLESRMQMINTVSHDLRSPLTTIRLSVDRLQNFAEGMDSKIAKILGVMAHEAQRLDTIIKAVLDRNRGDSLADQLSLKLGSPSMILENLEATLTLKAESRRIRSSLILEPASLNVRILLDPPAMQQVLFNLLENALKFTRSPGKVGVRSMIRDQQWVLEVWDTGRGIPKHQCARLFHPFEQVKEGDAQKGWGLGLYICRSIVEAHGGRIEVESIVAEGSTFRVFLPIVQPESLPEDSTDLERILSLRSETSGRQDVLGTDPVDH